jgi:hypothetical protein
MRVLSSVPEKWAENSTFASDCRSPGAGRWGLKRLGDETPLYPRAEVGEGAAVVGNSDGKLNQISITSI